MAEIQYLHLPSGSPPPTFPTTPFKTVLVIEQASSPEWRAEICERLIETGCLYVMAWGQDCEAWHDGVDWADLEASNFEDVPDEDIVMTTWHDDQILAEVFWFSGFCAAHPTQELDPTVILHIAAESRGDELVARYHAAQQNEDA